ncbi:MAG: DUF5671 domain-containing protein [bacterium]|nr:DUF5671 domain-containing protein [bacterium]MDZ4205827.1 DUF5671 domain-containing protein [Patescibacteria group bacterium]
MNTKITAKDFFLHIAVIALLYTGTVALLNILFSVINVAFPQITQYGYYGLSSISLPVATLIVAFPLFLFLVNLLRKGYVADPSRKDYPMRKWLIYITLFIAGGVLAGDLVTLIYYFLDGQEMTTAFLLKILSVLVVTGCIFGYYMDDLKDKLTGTRRNIWRVVGIILVIGSIVAGFNVLGTPQSQRMYRYDSQKVSDLQNIQWQIVNYWQQKGTLPTALTELQDSISGFISPIDPQTKGSYEYKKTGTLVFDLCAEFNKPTQTVNNSMAQIAYPEPMGKPGGTVDSWQHEAGRKCFQRTIDPELYPVRPK